MRLGRLFTLGTLHCLFLRVAAHGGGSGTHHDGAESPRDAPDPPRQLLPSCEDRPDAFQFKGHLKDCAWVGKNRPFRCLISAARETCPHTCRTCEPLVMTPYVFGLDDRTTDPTAAPTGKPSADPTARPRTAVPTASPTGAPTGRPTWPPTDAPSAPPTVPTTVVPSLVPSAGSSALPTIPITPPPSPQPQPRARAAVVVTDPPTSTSQNAQVLVTVLLDIINGTRTTFGLAPLTTASELARKAQQHAHAMADDQSLRYSAYTGGPASKWIGEIVGYGPSFEDVNKFLFESAEHRRAVLNPLPNQLGLAVSIDGDGTLWTCLILERI